jgi:hypothetical protein
VTSGWAVCLSVVMLEIIVPYITDQTREGLKCVA